MEVDCTALASSLCRDAWGREVITGEVWKAMNLATGDPDPWLGVKALADALGTEPVNLPGGLGPNIPAAGRLCFCMGAAGLVDGEIGPGWRGHVWLWLAMGGWNGVCIESSGAGPRVWDLNRDTQGARIRELADVVGMGGELVGPLEPMDAGQRFDKWTKGHTKGGRFLEGGGVAWVELP